MLIIYQYKTLLHVEGVTLEFSNEAIRSIAKISHKANEIAEDIGARRLHTVLEKVLEDISFNAQELQGQTICITPELVHEKLDQVIENQDLSRYIL